MVAEHRRVPRLSGDCPTGRGTRRGAARAGHASRSPTRATGRTTRPLAPGGATGWASRCPRRPGRARRPVAAGPWPLPVLLGAGAAIVPRWGSAARPARRLRRERGAMPVTIAAGFTPLGVFVLRRQPRHPVGAAHAAAGLVAASRRWRSRGRPAVAAWLSQWTWWPPLGAVPVLLLLVPDGRLPSPRWWPLAVVLVGAAGIATAALVAAASGEPRRCSATPTGAGAGGPAAPGHRPARLDRGGRRLARRARRRWSSGGGRPGRSSAGSSPACCPCSVLLGVGRPARLGRGPLRWVPAAVGLPLGLTLAVLRYRFEDLDLYVHRGSSGWCSPRGRWWSTPHGDRVGRVFIGLGVGAVPLLAAAAVAAVLAPGARLAQRAVAGCSTGAATSRTP